MRIKGMKLTRPGQLWSLAAYPRCSADAWGGVGSTARQGVKVRAVRCLAIAATMLMLGRSESVVAEDRIADAESAAKASASTPEGKKYENEVGAAFGRDQGKTLQACATKIKRPDLSDFHVFVRVNAAGQVEEALVKPSTDLATCLQGKLKGWNLATPPQADQWVRLNVRLRRK
jgi:hypothetical protein